MNVQLPDMKADTHGTLNTDCDVIKALSQF